MTAAQESTEPAAPEATYASIDDLFAHNPADVESADVDLPGGLRVKVRGLTRYELLNNAKGTDVSQVIEARNLATCLLEPRLTFEQVVRWQKSTKPSVMAPAVQKIRALSGLDDDAQKSDVPADGDDRP